MKDEIVLIAATVTTAATLAYCPASLAFLRELYFGVGCVVIAAAAGQAIKLVASKLGREKLSQEGTMMDEFMTNLLVRRSPSKTFVRLAVWNVLVSFIVISGGLISLGTISIIWAFLHLGLLGPGISILMRYPHSWVEISAVILSSALGIWGGLNFHSFLNNSAAVPTAIFALVLGLHVCSALLETLEIRRTEEP